MHNLSEKEQDEYATLAEQAELGQLEQHADASYGDDAAAVGREWLFAATGTSTLEEATHLALGRPKLRVAGQATKTWKVRTPAELDRSVREAAHRRGMTLSAYIRFAAGRQAESDSESA